MYPGVISSNIPLELYQLNIKNTFVNGVLDEKIYIEQSPGFVTQEECVKFCRLKRSLYDLNRLRELDLDALHH